MWVILILVAAVGATSPKRPECPFQSGPYVPPDCGPHGSFVVCPGKCQAQNCSSLWSKFRCDDDGCCASPTCICNEGYLKDDQTGECITVQQCMNKPNRPCTPTEKEVPCPITCPPQSCDSSYVSYLCAYKDESVPCVPGCNCIDNHLRDDKGICVPTEECPPPPWFKAKPTPKPVNPIRCGPNEVKVKCKTICPPQSCNISYTDYVCNSTYSCEEGCDCIKDYLRDDNGNCVLNDKCPPPPTNPTIEPPPTKPSKSQSSTSTHSESFSSSSMSKSSSQSSASSSSTRTSSSTKGKPKPGKCGVNEKWVRCKSICPPQSCAISYTSYLCEPPPPCEPGCDCIKDHLRDNNGVCVLNDKCPPPPTNPTIEPPVQETTAPPSKPSKSQSSTSTRSESSSSSSVSKSSSQPSASSSSTTISSSTKGKPKSRKCGVNEKWVRCKTICPPQSCAISYTSYLCEPPPPCEPGCDCIKDHLRDSNGVCVLNDKCPPPPVVIENPDETYPDYDCCGANQTRVPCKVPCPSDYCPVNDSPNTAICEAPNPCLPGCVCKLGYRLQENCEDETCILAEECPPVTCTRQNEEWNPCPRCLAENCADVNNQPSVCNELVHNCQPRCTCKKGFFRNDNGDCVPAVECPDSKCSVNETYVNCNVGCPTNNCPTSDTRAIVACSQPYPCPPGCACKRGYRRKSSENRSCILAEDCPALTCTRPNEVWNPCPSPCLSEYCGDQNNPPVICNELIKDCRPKCVCADGFYRNESDICVPANECPTKECPANQTYVSCNVRCPTENCPLDDSRFMVACAIAYPCPPGCACLPNYRRKSYDDDTCILAEDCPPVKCTRQNEEWNSCPSPCISEYCEDANKSPSACYESGQGCQPKCVCKQGFFRNRNDTCVPINECPPPKCPGPNEEWNTCPSPCLSENCLDKNNPPSDCKQSGYDCKPKCVCQSGFFRDDNNICVPFSECGKGLCNANETYAFCKSGCPYDYCPEDDSLGIIACDPPYPCPKGCICKPNYKRRSREDETCILTEECPPLPCDRPNEVWDPCTSSCLAESCRDYLEPPGVCNEFVKSCQPKCVCQKGYYRNDSGICVPGKECGVKCGVNEMYSDCNFGCPQDFCPADDDLGIILCKPPRDCPAGCRCKLNYKWKSFDDRTCVLASDCPPVNCTRPHEKWSPCPSPCLAESCEDVDNQPKTCNYFVQNCQPRCICEKNFFRNEDGMCVFASKCPKKKTPTEE